MVVQPAQRSAPQKPLVDVSGQNGRRVDGGRVDRVQESAHLSAPLSRMQTEVRCQDAQRRTVAVEDNVKRRTRLVPRDGEIDRLHRLYPMSGQQRVTVIAVNR